MTAPQLSEQRVLLIIPAIIAVIGALMYLKIRPIYAGLREYDYDPAYAYILNGLSVYYNYVPNLLEHPGTPVHFVSCAISVVAWFAMPLFGSMQMSLAEFVYAHPEPLIAAVSFTFLLMNATATYVLGAVTLHSLQSIRAALLMQTADLFLNANFFRIMHLNSDAAGMIGTLLLMAIVIRELFDRYPRGILWHLAPFAAGIAVALAVTSKITFLPLLPLLLLLRSPARIFVGLVTMTVAAAIFLMPLWPKLPHFAAWVGNLATRTGHYGTGEKGLVEWAMVPERSLSMFVVYPLTMAAVIGFLLVAVRYARQRWSAGIRGGSRGILQVDPARVVLVLTPVTLGLVAIGIKHFGYLYSPYSHHVVLLALLTPLLVLVIAWGFPGSSQYTGERLISLATIWVAVVGGGYLAREAIKMRVESLERDRTLAQMSAAIASVDRPLIIAGGARHQKAALHFGLAYIDWPLQRMAAGDRADNLAFDPWRGFHRAGLPTADVKFVQDLIAAGRTPLLLLRSDFEPPKGLILETLFRSRRERLLRVVGTHPHSP